jgi:hypothetical protein
MAKYTSEEISKITKHFTCAKETWRLTFFEWPNEGQGMFLEFRSVTTKSWE